MGIISHWQNGTKKIFTDKISYHVLKVTNKSQEMINFPQYNNKKVLFFAMKCEHLFWGTREVGLMLTDTS